MAKQKIDLETRQMYMYALDDDDHLDLRYFLLDARWSLNAVSLYNLTDTIRSFVWPFLLCAENGAENKEVKLEVAHRDEDQVLLDVRRSFNGFLSDETDKALKRSELQQVIVHVLRKYPALNYFQGYHDIISLILLVLNDTSQTKACAEAMSLFRLRDNMTKTLEPTMGYLRILRALLWAASPPLAALTEEMPTVPYFSWVLTLLSHDIDSQPITARFFDVILTHNPAMVCYLAVAIVIKKHEITEIPLDIADDPGLLHQLLSRLPVFKLHADSDARSRTSSQSEEETLSENGLVGHSDLSASFISTNSTTSSSQSHKHLLESIYTDPDVNVPAISPSPSASQPSHTSETGTPPIKSVSVEEAITFAAQLWQRYPLDSEAIQADRIMGPKSVIFTWREGAVGLTQAEAEEIVQLPTSQIVLPAPVEKPVRPTTKQPRFPFLLQTVLQQKRVSAVILISVGVVILAMYKPHLFEKKLTYYTYGWAKWFKNLLNYR